METMFGQLLAMNNDVVITIVMMLILGLRQTLDAMLRLNPFVRESMYCYYSISANSIELACKLVFF